jgi:threonine dehydrogenase-like Zn-dependent dehydrogenase
MPSELGRLGVLAEPTSICTRGVRHALTIGSRQPWAPKRALVTGAGAVGLLSTMLLRLEGLDVWTASLEPSNEIADALGAHYVQVADGALADLAPFDIVIEAAGDAQSMANAIGLLGRGGVACLLGIDGRDHKVTIDGRVIGMDAVLQNRVLVGSVNAHRQDWDTGVQALAEANRRYRDALESLVALRVPLDRFADAFAFHGGKATLVVSDA